MFHVEGILEIQSLPLLLSLLNQYSVNYASEAEDEQNIVELNKHLVNSTFRAWQEKIFAR